MGVYHNDLARKDRSVDRACGCLIEIGAPVFTFMTQAGIAGKVRICVDHRADITAFDAAFDFQGWWQKSTVMAQR